MGGLPQDGGMDKNAENSRKLENAVRLGHIVAVDAAAARCRVESGGLTSDWLPWLAIRAGSDKSWWPPSEGEQVVLLCPGGNPAQGIALLGVYSDANAAPSASLDEVVIASFRDGTVITYDTASHELAATVKGDVALSASGDVLAEVQGDMSATVGGTLEASASSASIKAATIALTGEVTVTGNVHVSGDVVAGIVSLSTHVHGGVQNGGGMTSPPV